MPIRRVAVGVMTFIDDKGITQYALAGQQVRVHARDVGRFDRLNAAAAEAAPQLEPDLASDNAEDGPS